MSGVAVNRLGSGLTVGMIGKKRSGKDTFAKTLVDEFAFTRLAFADPLKEAVLKVDPFVFVDERGPWRLSRMIRDRGWERAKECREVRRLLQEYGVAIREIQEDFWLDATVAKMRDEDRNYVVTDCRFPNEADAIRALGGFIVRVTRPGQDESDSHASENALNGYSPDFVVHNDSTLEDLAMEARRVAAELF